MTLAAINQDRFRIDRLLSNRGIREKYLGTDLLTNSTVVIESIHETLQNDESAKSAIDYEIEASRKLRSKYFVDFIGSYEKDGRTYNVWSYADAQSISEINSFDQLTTRDVCNFISKALDALIIAHKLGIIHGAISSDVVLITPAIEPVIVGFTSHWGQSITDPGTIRGVSQYQCAAPELYKGESIDESCDFYAIGVIAKYLFSKVNSDGIPTEVQIAKNLILSMVSPERNVRNNIARMVAERNFIDSMHTPARGNQQLVLTKKQLRTIKRNIKRFSKSEKRPRNDTVNILIAVVVRVSIIAFIAIIATLVVLKLM